MWAVVAFLYATAPFETAGRGTVDNSTLFGDGVLYAGSILLHALDQRHRYELLDFGMHVTDVHQADSQQSTDPSLLAFMQRAALMRRTQERFTAMLEARDAPTVNNVWRRL